MSSIKYEKCVYSATVIAIYIAHLRSKTIADQILKQNSLQKLIEHRRLSFIVEFIRVIQKTGKGK